MIIVDWTCCVTRELKGKRDRAGSYQAHYHVTTEYGVHDCLMSGVFVVYHRILR